MNTNAISDSCPTDPNLFNNMRLEMESDNFAIFGSLGDIQSFSCLQQGPPSTEFSPMSCNEELIASTKRKATESLDDSRRCLRDDVDGISEELRKTKHERNSKRISSTDTRNAYERMRRHRIKDKMKALQELLPHSYKQDKVSMLDDAIDYLKALKLHVKMLSDMCRGAMWQAPGTTTATNFCPFVPMNPNPMMGVFSTCQCGSVPMVPPPLYSANLQLQPSSSSPPARFEQMSAHFRRPSISSPPLLRGAATFTPLPTAVSHR